MSEGGGATRFYIHSQRGREGPFDLAAMMRKIRTGRLPASTQVSVDGNDTPRRAWEQAELAPFFQAGNADAWPKQASAIDILSHVFSNGWRFVSQQPVVCVLTGTGVLLVYTAILTLYGLVPWWALLWIGSILHIVMQSMVMIVVLHLHRGQGISGRLLRRKLPSLLPALLLFSVIYSVLGTLGLLALLVPGFCLLALFAFTPFLIADRRLGIFSALSGSAGIALRHGAGGFGVLTVLMAINILNCILIVTIPIVVPLLAAALADLYDEWGY